MSRSEVSVTGFMFGFMGKVRLAVHSSIVNDIPSKAKQQSTVNQRLLYII